MRKINPKFDELYKVFRHRILPEYVETRPKLVGVTTEKELPSEQPFGIIFVPAQQEKLITNIFLSTIPITSSLKQIRLLFDENLRKALFDYLSYKLAIESKNEDLAVKFRDMAMKKYPKDYQTIEKLDNDGKLTNIILEEATLRLNKSCGKVTTSDVEEFSKLVRKLAELNVSVIRADMDKPISYYRNNVNQILKNQDGIVLLARGKDIERAVDIAELLKKENNLQLIPPQKLNLQNPEIGTWTFIYPEPKNVSFIRIWLEK